ncbi:MAG: hypothetical protein LBL86_07575 [Coriobacteriales bacterium]|jgi:hypothetical protein|nr:hypothetical protein [Coriobacteriales bacterium]
MSEYRDMQEDTQGSSGTGFVALWTALIMAGMALEFLARLLGHAGNPTGMFHPLIPASTGILAALVVLSGVFLLTGEKGRREGRIRRRGVLLVALGAVMLASFFVFKQAIPLIFG